MTMKDKKYHVLAGLLVAAFVGIPCYQFTFDEAAGTYHLAAAIWATIVSGILLAGCKEYCDMRTEGNKFDLWDFLATCIGAVIVALFIIGLHFGKG